MAGDDAERWLRVKSIVGELIELDDEERSARLAALVGDDVELRREVEEWLAVEREADGFLQSPAPGASWERGAAAPIAPGTRIGSFRVEALLGSGGSSVVFRARQESPARDVALKVLLEGVAGSGGRARFEHEAEVLASLRHEGIAAVLDAGVHRDGDVELPWLAMELVPGARPLTAHVSTRGLDRAARVRLLVRVARAVGHGHRRGVIHRDLKPDNVLVDEDGAPRVIDFGLAKLQSPDGDGARHTLPGSVLGTVGYMSPEHAASDPSAIDVRSDVYALGVIAYEVTCGAMPYSLESRTLSDALRVIREATPRRPREHGVPRDLEAVLLRALEKDPERRYASAVEFADDLERWAAGEPVRARGASFAYHARHFARRRRWALLATGAALASLVVVLAVSSARASKIEERERARLEEVKDFLLSAVELTGPGVSASADMRVDEWLGRTAGRIDDELAANPLAKLELHATVGKAFRELGRYDEAEHHLRRGVAVAGEIGTVEARAATLSSLADVLLEVERPGEAEAALSEALELLRGGSPQPIFTAILMRKSAEARRQSGDVEGARELAEDALGRYEDAFGGTHEAVARGAETLARVHLDAGDGEAAEAAARRALDVDVANHGATSLAAGRSRRLVADALELRGEHERAERERAAARGILEEVLPADHPLLAPAR